MCSRALKASAVSDEPFIHTRRDNQKTPGLTEAPIDKDLRGDIGVHGFWTKQQSTIFDVRITDTDCTSARDEVPRKILAQHEREKKKTSLTLAASAYDIFGIFGLTAKQPLLSTIRDGVDKLKLAFGVDHSRENREHQHSLTLY
jgi:hypothetical protein